MFTKLLKYEFQSIGKWYLLTNLVMLVASTILGFAFKPIVHQYRTDIVQSSNINVGNNAYGIFLLVITLAIIGLVFFSLFATLFIIIRRFYTNVYGKQGYLTLTLPVNNHQIIISKLLAAVIWQIFNFAIIGFSLILFFIPALGLDRILQALPQLIKGLELVFANISLLLMQQFIGLFSSVLVIYLAISIGQLFSDRRGLLAFVFYLIITFGISTLSAVLGDYQIDGSNTHTLIVSICIELVTMIVSYFATNYIMTHKLNIQ